MRVAMASAEELMSFHALCYLSYYDKVVIFDPVCVRFLWSLFTF